MSRQYYYLITALPATGQLGGESPMTSRELLARLSDAPAPRALVEALLLGDDLLQREALLAGEADQVDPTVLAAAQVRDEAPLPAYLQTTAEDRARKIAVDATWAAYYRHVDSVADDLGSEFLRQWCRHEVGLRNALAAARAKALQLEPGDYLVNAQMGQGERDFDAVIGEWSAASNPLDGLRVLDNERWNWISYNDAWFSFSADEIAAYAAKLMLQNRWQRLETARAKAREQVDASA